ncbi:MAG TPA: hypothetical protein GXZ32_03195, partial [Clostridiales bacterium]|nr:hypothetical protein [Clostridiales bacterium]
MKKILTISIIVFMIIIHIETPSLVQARAHAQQPQISAQAAIVMEA